MEQQQASSLYDRTVAALTGQRPDRIPFVGRLELWHRGLLRTGQLPAEFADMSLTDIHRAVGFGRQQMLAVFNLRLCGVEVVVEFNDEVVYREEDPVVERFPDVEQYIPRDRPGQARTRLITPVGTLVGEHIILEEMLASGARGHTSKHPIGVEEDLDTAAYIVERMEYVPCYDRLRETQAEFARDGFAVPMLPRIPFQQLLIDYFTTTDFFLALYDWPESIGRVMGLVDEWMTDAMQQLSELDVPYVEFGDNLDGSMTNPRLFREYCLPAYQRYTDILHGQGKRVGSHTDGNLLPLFSLLAESGLDVCESFTPAPLTSYNVADALAVWQGKPTFWGGIPSPLLEPRTGEAEFERYMYNLLEVVGDRPVLFDVVDMVLPNNDINRVRRIAEMVESYSL